MDITSTFLHEQTFTVLNFNKLQCRATIVPNQWYVESLNIYAEVETVLCLHICPQNEGTEQYMEKELAHNVRKIIHSQ